MAFKKIGEADLSDTPSITFETGHGGRAHRVRLSTSTFRSIGTPAAIHFEWDDEESLLRIVASSPDDPAAFHLGPQRRAVIPRLLDHLGVSIEQTTSLPATSDGPLSVIADLSEYRSR